VLFLVAFVAVVRCGRSTKSVSTAPDSKQADASRGRARRFLIGAPDAAHGSRRRCAVVGRIAFGLVYVAAQRRALIDGAPTTEQSRTEAACQASAALHCVYNLCVVAILAAVVVVAAIR
jgi:hypothetical protein